jgi:hypothetical protein
LNAAFASSIDSQVRTKASALALPASFVFLPFPIQNYRFAAAFSYKEQPRSRSFEREM